MSGDQNRLLAGNGVFLILNLILPYWKSMEFCHRLSCERDLTRNIYKKQSYSSCQRESSVRISLRFQYKSVPAWEWKRNMGRDKCLIWVELLNAVVEPFIFLHNPWSLKTEGKQRQTKRLKSVRVWFHAEVFTWKALVLPLVMLFSFLYLQTKISEYFTHVN